MPLLVGWLGDDRDDPTFTQMGADRARRIGLVAADTVRSRAGPARATPSDVEMVHEHREHRCVPGLTWTDEHDQRQTAPINEVMNLRAQSAARPADRVVRRFLAQILVTR